MASNLSSSDPNPSRTSAATGTASDGSDKDSTSTPLSFEQALQEIEMIVGQLESGRLGLEQALERYEAGVRHLKHCHQALRQAERKIELLVGIHENGVAVTRPFDDDAVSLEEKHAARSRRRTLPPENPPRTGSLLDEDPTA